VHLFTPGGPLAQATTAQQSVRVLRLTLDVRPRRPSGGVIYADVVPDCRRLPAPGGPSLRQAIQALLSIPLTLLGWAPGVIHALFVVNNHYAEQRNKRLIQAVERNRFATYV
jgi:hypothetical protein